MNQFRFAKEIGITHWLSNADNQKHVYGFLKILSDELQYPNIQTALIKLFLSSKTKFNDESIDNILNFCNQNLPKTTIKKSLNKNTNAAFAHIEHLPKDVFNHIGSYLPLKSSLILSQSNHLLHKMILNNDYFNRCNNNYSLTLNNKNIKLIINNNSNLQYYRTNDSLYIKSIYDGNREFDLEFFGF